MGGLRLGLIGLGTMGQRVHLPNFLRAPDCQVVAVADVRANLAVDVARRFGIPKATLTAEELIADPELDALAMLLPPQLNPPLGIPALRSGKHLFVEKPLAVDAAPARALAAAAAEAGRALSCGYMKRYDPGVVAAKALLEQLHTSGELGAIAAAEYEFFEGDWTRNFSPLTVASAQPSRPMAQIEGGGVPTFVRPEHTHLYFALATNKCHQVNLMRWLLGDPAALAFSRLRPPAGQRGATRLLAIFDYGSYDCTLRTAQTFTEHHWEELTIHFEHGWLRLQLPPPLAENLPARLQVYRKGTGRQEIAPTWEWAFRREAAHFVQCALGRAPNLSPGDDSVKDLEILEVLYHRQYLGEPEARWSF